MHDYGKNYENHYNSPQEPMAGSGGRGHIGSYNQTNPVRYARAQPCTKEYNI